MLFIVMFVVGVKISTHKYDTFFSANFGYFALFSIYNIQYFTTVGIDYSEGNSEWGQTVTLWTAIEFYV